MLKEYKRIMRNMKHIRREIAEEEREAEIELIEEQEQQQQELQQELQQEQYNYHEVTNDKRKNKKNNKNSKRIHRHGQILPNGLTTALHVACRSVPGPVPNTNTWALRGLAAALIEGSIRYDRPVGVDIDIDDDMNDDDYNDGDGLEINMQIKREMDL